MEAKYIAGGAMAIIVLYIAFGGGLKFEVSGSSCSPSGALACESQSNNVQLVCSGGSWSFNQFCSSGGTSTWCNLGACTTTPVSDPPPGTAPPPPSGGTPTQPACQDSDGLSALIKGTTISGSLSQTDSCKDSTTVYEYYCADSTHIAQTETLCAGSDTPICSDGRCVSATAPTCTDTDGGIDYFTSGTAVQSTRFSDGTNSRADYCFADGKTLLEYYCSSGQISSRSTICDYRCQWGQCISAPACAAVNFVISKPYTTTLQGGGLICVQQASAGCGQSFCEGRPVNDLVVSASDLATIKGSLPAPAPRQPTPTQPAPTQPAPTQPRLGDGRCDQSIGETCSNAPQDCGACTPAETHGNRICEGNEPVTYPQDCQVPAQCSTDSECQLATRSCTMGCQGGQCKSIFTQPLPSVCPSGKQSVFLGYPECRQDCPAAEQPASPGTPIVWTNIASQCIPLPKMAGMTGFASQQECAAYIQASAPAKDNTNIAIGIVVAIIIGAAAILYTGRR